jgi:hypothetical protein
VKIKKIILGKIVSGYLKFLTRFKSPRNVKEDAMEKYISTIRKLGVRIKDFS